MNSDSLTTAAQAELIQQAQEGDGDAFAALFQANKTWVYSLCLRMTNNVAEAEDLMQEAFLQVFRKLATFRGESAFSTWLYRLTVNTVLMHFRKKSLAQVSLDEPYTRDQGAKPMPREYGTRDLCLAGCVDRLALIQAIQELPEGYRIVFLLHEVEGYEHSEIAEFLGCSTGNSKSQLHKARLRIRELLNARRNVRREARTQKNSSDSVASFFETRLCLTPRSRTPVPAV